MTTLAEKVPPQFWPTIDRIDYLRAEFGLPGIRATLEEIALFDPDAIRATLPAWGTGGANGAVDDLDDVLSTTLTKVTTLVGERWEGAAFQKFSEDITHVQDLIAAMAEPARLTGDQIEEFLNAVEIGWMDVASMVLAVAGVVIALVGSVVARVGAGTPVGVVGLILEISGHVVGLAGLILTFMQTVLPRIEACRELVQRLREQVFKLTPAERGGPYPTPPSKDWDQKTMHPDT